VDTAEKLRQLIPAIISRELQSAPFFPAINDQYGAFKAMAALLPAPARDRLAASVEAGQRTVEEVALYSRLPESYVDIWLRWGRDIESDLDKV
jgi:hypothetical protein